MADLERSWNGVDNNGADLSHQILFAYVAGHLLGHRNDWSSRVLTQVRDRYVIDEYCR